MKWQLGVLGLMLGASASTAALADGRSATRNFYDTLARAGSRLESTAADTTAAPTLVRGIYSLSDRRGRFMGFTNEAGNLFGDSRGFNVFPPNGARPRPMTPDEIAELKAEVIGSIDIGKLPKVVHGNGGGRQILLRSAVDCGYCKGFEDSMRGFDRDVNTTFYVVPSSLQQTNNGGLGAWQAVSKIWCASDSGAAWKNFWATRTIPAARQCEFADPRAAESAAQYLNDIFAAVGVKVGGVPKFIREDGLVINNRVPLEAAYASATFGPAGKPPAADTRPARWLVSAADAGSPVQGEGSSHTPTSAADPQQPQKKTVNLKSLFGL